MNTKKTVFLTGSTGLLGSSLAYDLFRRNYDLILLMRNKKQSAEERLHKCMNYLFEDPDEYRRFRRSVEIINGDITLDNLGIDPGVFKKILPGIDIVLHSAALTDFSEPYEELAKHNIEGTRNVLEFASKIDGAEFHHVSTAYICGQSNGYFSEDELDVGQNFNNSYEETKFMAEKMVNEYRDRLSVRPTIYRPSIIVGSSRTGKTLHFVGVYSFMKAIFFMVQLFAEDLQRDGKRARTAGASYKDNKLNIPLRIPARADKTLNIVPVDYVVDTIISVIEHQESSGKTYHIVNPAPPTIREINHAFCSFFNVSGIEIADPEQFVTEPMTEWETFFINTIREVVPYLQKKEPFFHDQNTRDALNGSDKRCPGITEEIVAKLITYYTDNIRLKK